MRIGFDLDKVFINTPPLIPNRFINKIYKKRDNDILLYRIPSKPDQLLRKTMHLPIFRHPIKENVAFLKDLSKEKKHQLFLISSRFKFLEPQTQQLIKRHGFDKMFEKLYFNYDDKQPHEFKNDILRKLNLDVFVDDDLSLVRYIAKDNPKTKFFWLDNNKSNATLEKNIVAIAHLSEIFRGKK